MKRDIVEGLEIAAAITAKFHQCCLQKIVPPLSLSAGLYTNVAVPETLQPGQLK